RQLLRQFDLPLDRKLKHLSRGMRMKVAQGSSLSNLVVLENLRAWAFVYLAALECREELRR
ncbi:MAG TPA: hypothetical protein VK798_00375, partial [Alloacidobacterium sp.]|nr:hypothetical protein [Alloacidobacterium sp.]